MPSSDPSHRRRRLAVVVLGVAVIAIMASVGGTALVEAQTGATGTTGTTGSSVSYADPNDYTCDGHIQLGTAETGVTGTEVEYEFACGGNITGYEIETEPHQIQYFDQAPVVSLNGTPTTDSFSCDGSVPGLQINCVGGTSQPWEVISGQFVINGNICTEPRVDPILTVTDATATTTIGGTKAAPTATAAVTQYISGPFDLGRPHGCKADQDSSNTRLGDNPPEVVLPGPAKKS